MAQPIPCDYADGAEAAYLIGDLETGQQHSVCLEHLLPWAMAVVEPYIQSHEEDGAAEVQPEPSAPEEAGAAEEPAPSFPEEPAEGAEPAGGADDQPPPAAEPAAGDGGGDPGLEAGGDAEPEGGAEPGAGDELEP